jgi:hypothetical protein
MDVGAEHFEGRGAGAGASVQVVAHDRVLVPGTSRTSSDQTGAYGSTRIAPAREVTND